jgi:hypothetical protein
MTNRTLPDDAEALIAQFIRSNFVALGHGLDRPMLKSIVFMPIQSMVAKNLLLPTIFNFKWSNHFLNKFLRRRGLSFRRARAGRRPETDDEECAIFMVTLKKMARDFPEASIRNFDESGLLHNLSEYVFGIVLTRTRLVLWAKLFMHRTAD